MNRDIVDGRYLEVLSSQRLIAEETGSDRRLQDLEHPEAEAVVLLLEIVEEVLDRPHQHRSQRG